MLSLIKLEAHGDLGPSYANGQSNPRRRWTLRKLSRCWMKSGGASSTHATWTFLAILREKIFSSSTAIQCCKRSSRIRSCLLERGVSDPQAPVHPCSDGWTALGFQILHILYSAEKFLERLKNQSSNFEVIFFECSCYFLTEPWLPRLNIPSSKYLDKQPITFGRCQLVRFQFSISRE